MLAVAKLMPRDNWELLLKRPKLKEDIQQLSEAQKKNLQLSSFMPHLLLLCSFLMDEQSKTLASPNLILDDTVAWDLATSN